GGADARVQQAGAAAVVHREREPRHVEHRHLAHAQHRVVGHAHAFGGVHVDPLRTQFPAAVLRRAGGIGRAVQRPQRALQLDVLGAAVAAPRHQLVADVADVVAVVDLAALGLLGDQAHAGVLVAHAAGGDVVPGLHVVGELVGAQVLVAAAQGDVAGDAPARLRAADLVALDVGGLLAAFL